MERKRIWLGCSHNRREVFRFAGTPTRETHGDTYAQCIGPFRTIRGARFMAEKGLGNPHCVTVRDAERLGKKYGT